MELRKLRQEEHWKTRNIWERIFTEDTPEFLDYYYSVKTAENQIYVIEDENTICAMLQLNPYQIQAGGKQFTGHYIVAVATDERYRRRKFMAGLLKKAMDDMRDAGEAFTFLMPAAEVIYYPHGFRYIYRQKQGKVKGRKEADCKYTVSFAGKEDCAALADFVNKQITGKYQVFAKRDSHYYEVLLKEQASENGALVLVKENERLVGCFLYAKGEEYEIREPLFLPEDEEAFQNAVYLLIGNEELEVKCQAYGEEEKPLIMAKILNIPQMFECMEAVRDVKLYLEITDEPQEELPVRFRVSGRERLTAAEETACLEAASLSEEPERLTIGTLTSLVFGCVDAEELAVSENFKKEWAKIKPLSKIFLNEIV